MERKMNASSGSYGSNSSYRNKSTYEENSDEENNEEDLLDGDTSDLFSSEAVAGEDLRSGSPEEYSSSPKPSPILPRRRVVSPGGSTKISSPTESQTRVKHTTAHEVQGLSTSGLNPSPYGLCNPRKPLHSTPLESPRSRSQVTSQRKVQATVTCKLSDVSRESPSAAVKKVPSSRAKKSVPPIGEAAPVVSNESLKPLVQENLAAIALCVVLIVTGLYALIHVTTDKKIEKYDDSKLEPSHILEDFLQEFDQLNSSFPTQTSTFWKVLRSGTRSIIVQDYPIAPAVFIVAVPKDAQQTALCIVRKYAAVVTRAFQGHPPIEFTHHLRSADTPEHIKHVIDDTLNHGFSDGSRVAIIHELDKLHGKAAMMFHGYCDNENAPFTRVVVLFTLFMDAVNEETDDFVERKLSQVWGKYLDNDKLFPLLSRIGNRNAFVRQENSEILEAHSCL